MTDDSPADTVVQKEYIAHIRVRVHSQEIEDGNDLHDWEDRMEAEIETEDHTRSFRQIKAPTLNQVLDKLEDVDTREVAQDGE